MIPLTASLSGVHWHDWNEILDLITEIEKMIRHSDKDLPPGLKLEWKVSMIDENTLRLGVEYTSDLRGEHPVVFEVTLFCKDLEAGTTITLNGVVLQNNNYKQPIAATLRFALSCGAAVPA